ARVAPTATAVYAPMFRAAAHAASLGASPARECADAALSVIPPRSRVAEAVRAARDLRGDWEAVVDELYARYGGYHPVHAINNTALVAAGLYAFDGFSPAGFGGVQRGWGAENNRGGAWARFRWPRTVR